MYFHCQTRLVDNFKTLFPDTFSYEKNRAIVFDENDSVPVNEPYVYCPQPNGWAGAALTYHNQMVEPRAIKRTALFTVEGEKDDICAVGQTLAAHDLCSSLRPYRKRHHMQAGVGHYGVFSGKSWQQQIYSIMKNVILQSD